ncbi:Uncharacterized protein LB4E_2957 [Leptospira borgpetersenii str. 4E]|nr:Uncharacterized protein LB4E_2957 [Leptospira borgpetersenii str. 4E]
METDGELIFQQLIPIRKILSLQGQFNNPFDK